MDGISNVGGNVSINNIGAMTVGAAGVNATGGIDLPVASSAGSAANLTLNGVLASAGGNINSLAGNNISVNADVATSAPGLVTLTAVNGVITYAAGVSISDAHGTVIPVPVVPPAVMPVNPASPAAPVAPSPPDGGVSGDARRDASIECRRSGCNVDTRRCRDCHAGRSAIRRQ
ncbi:hypothetical protein [Paraburkholderia saeva]|uniref:Uncharacterized protein n=1 Tax=Paraburkholderia saeva TaxID=2777537 RepID=A0A9N8S099_9BURK|nr:hypothetical protein [Paraburkholderia saeva]CAG4916974.1 hypothetical protein LMG31841_04632 [Paraburkholderia saeva]